LVLLSGGIDSAVCTHFLLSQGYNVSALHIDYGQGPAIHEKFCSIELAKYFSKHSFNAVALFNFISLELNTKVTTSVLQCSSNSDSGLELWVNSLK